MDTQYLETLIAVRGLIQDPINWTQGDYAVDSEDNRVDPDHPTAYRWCLMGAVWKVSERGYMPIFEKQLQSFIGTGYFPLEWNDRSTHEEVILGLDKAIQHEEKLYHDT